MIAYVSIGNSDDKLSQRDWVLLQLDTKQVIHDAGAVIHGEWHSYPDSIFQNACLCFDVDENKVPELKGTLAAIAVEYRQDSIAWASIVQTEFLGQQTHTLNHPNSDRWTGGDKKDAQ